MAGCLGLVGWPSSQSFAKVFYLWWIGVAKFRSSFSRRTLVDWIRLPVVGCLARAAWLGVAAWLGLATCLGLAAWLGLPDWG